ncbi:MAG: hypothetical protein ACOCZ8_01760 [Bacteroidota bacterium]
MLRIVHLPILVLVAYSAFGQSEVLRVPVGLNDSTITKHRMALELLNDMYAHPGRFVDTAKTPKAYHTNQSKRYYSQASKSEIKWLVDQGYIFETLFIDELGDAHPMLHLNPELEFTYQKNKPSPELSIQTALALSGSHLRKAWTAQSVAFGVGLVGGCATVIFYMDDRTNLGTATLGFTVLSVLLCEIVFLSHQVQRGKVLELLPGGARYTF